MGDPIKIVPPTGDDEASECKFTIRAPLELAQEIRDCQYTLSGPPHGLTITEFFEAAARRELDRLKRLKNGGRSWMRRPASFRLKRGRKPSR